MLDGKRLIDHVADALEAQTDALAICGRDEPGRHCLADRPEPGLGPLGGLAAALRHACEDGHEAVLSAGCDAPDLPRNLLDQLRGEGPAIAERQPVIGYWPATLSPVLDGFLAGDGRSLYGFAEEVGARSVTVEPPLANINRPVDLERFSNRLS